MTHKLTHEDADSIRKQYAEGERVGVLALAYGVTRTTRGTGTRLYRTWIKAVEVAGIRVLDVHYELAERLFAASSLSADEPMNRLIEQYRKRIKVAEGPEVISELAQLNLLLKAEMLMQDMPLAVQAAETEGPEGRQRLRERLIREMEDGQA